jgi:predicted nucleic acid-binding protein
MSLFVDTSALIAVLDRDQPEHRRAAKAWSKLLDDEESLVTCSYVLVELIALAQARLGMDAVHAIDDVIQPLLSVIWVDEEIHQRATAALRLSARRKLSLVDCAAFEVMRRAGISRAFSIDRHFRQAGFEVIP